MCNYELPIPIVYFADIGNGCIKVGKTMQPLIRMRAFNCSSSELVAPTFMTPGDFLSEKIVLNYFRHSRVGGKREVLEIEEAQLLRSWNYIPRILKRNNFEFYNTYNVEPELIHVSESVYKYTLEAWDTRFSEQFIHVFDELFKKLNKWKGVLCG